MKEQRFFCAFAAEPSRSNMELINDLKEFVQLLDAHEVKYMIVGGAAVNVLGFVRSRLLAGAQ